MLYDLRGEANMSPIVGMLYSAAVHHDGHVAGRSGLQGP